MFEINSTGKLYTFWCCGAHKLNRSETIGEGSEIMQKRIKTPTTCSINKTIEALFVLHLHVVHEEWWKQSSLIYYKRMPLFIVITSKITSFMNTKWTKEVVREAQFQHNGKRFSQSVWCSFVLTPSVQIWILFRWMTRPYFPLESLLMLERLIFDMNYITMWMK